MDEQDVPISNTDELTAVGGYSKDHTRHLSDYKPTNAPLSAYEIDHRKQHWPPDTLGDIEDMTPIPEPEPIVETIS